MCWRDVDSMCVSAARSVLESMVADFGAWPDSVRLIKTPSEIWVDKDEDGATSNDAIFAMVAGWKSRIDLATDSKRRSSPTVLAAVTCTRTSQ